MFYPTDRASEIRPNKPASSVHIITVTAIRNNTGRVEFKWSRYVRSSQIFGRILVINRDLFRGHQGKVKWKLFLLKLSLEAIKSYNEKPLHIYPKMNCIVK